MEKDDKETEKILLPHHEQQALCVTRLPYRQGRKLTAVKVYTITKESNHLLIFGVPSLNLRQETKALFIRFGKLLQFNISKNHAAEPFTETYHAHYERIQSARIAKKLLDTRNFYGGSLHICYAPELETVDETRQKLIQRQKDVLFRLKNLDKEEKLAKDNPENSTDNTIVEETQNTDKKVLNMGEVNVISLGSDVKKFKRRKYEDVVIEKRFKPCFDNETHNNTANNNDSNQSNAIINEIVNINVENNRLQDNVKLKSSNVKRTLSDLTEIEIVDCTSVDKPTISNINEALNYNKFGEETVLKVQAKPVNKIKFNVNKNSLIYKLVLFIYRPRNSEIDCFSMISTLKY